MIRCEECHERFGGWFTYRRHRPLTWDRCRSAEEMRGIGLRRNRWHVWVRTQPNFQTRFDSRSFSLVRRLFGKSYRALSPQERRRYRQVLSGLSGKRVASTAGIADLRNAHGPTGRDAA